MDVIETKRDEKPTVIIVIGMAGSGKTTFMQRINSHLREKGDIPYVLNLDPAVTNLPFEANIDIKKTIDYKSVMKDYNLGPNGAILTSLNLFTTKFDQVLNILEKRAGGVKNVIIDTPGQIEIFTWSASGSIITDSLASTFPTVVAYVVDSVRTESPMTFMSNMLYACSILYKTQLPFVMVFNKTDIVSHERCLEWLRDFEKFQEALMLEEDSYMNSLMNSMSLMLDEFYNQMRVVGVSSVTGAGIPDFFVEVESARKEYFEDYLPQLEKKVAEKKEKEAGEKQAELDALLGDLEVKDR
ncbi:hypothetical protein BB559_001770 [Furculomyces boomerangus]|uniref:GPN-loop GTPase n=2 Tax=Harpellales TaxID=61421 RepID=A0A2T9Z0T3_9FUNG|nr:hypothetical protein BB559_001770 [Furculomyces boomerangus]PVZ99278.1 hypothetical protein BB558_004712 [Smittium angustum]